ncbi:MAG: CBS domain-containing protein [Pirellulaceae bacterium]|jgi:CBS domain-containing protein|nr:CBS domain-containing protein [Pirellulaceae bacterium]MDP7019072.1 CBS domain-containing protein [Pirellulaceae bacterium]
MKLRDVLSAKDNALQTIEPSASLAQVVAKLVDANCGSLIVVDADVMVGIITERDILRTVATCGDPLAEIEVYERMTGDVITGDPNDDIQSAMATMTNHRIRHLPVMKDGSLSGMISIGDLVKTQQDLLAVENHYLKTYIQG